VQDGDGDLLAATRRFARGAGFSLRGSSDNYTSTRSRSIIS